jgi:hypothetical protein
LGTGDECGLLNLHEKKWKCPAARDGEHGMAGIPRK